MDFKHEINGLKDQGDKNHVDENVSNHGSLKIYFFMHESMNHVDPNFNFDFDIEDEMYSKLM